MIENQKQSLREQLQELEKEELKLHECLASICSEKELLLTKMQKLKEPESIREEFVK